MLFEFKQRPDLKRLQLAIIFIGITDEAGHRGVDGGNLDKLAAFSADTEKCSGKFPVAGDPDLKIVKQYDAVLAVRPTVSSRTSYVISPTGEVLLAYENLSPNDHVTQALAAVKAYKAKK